MLCDSIQLLFLLDLLYFELILVTNVINILGLLNLGFKSMYLQFWFSGVPCFIQYILQLLPPQNNLNNETVCLSKGFQVQQADFKLM